MARHRLEVTWPTLQTLPACCLSQAGPKLSCCFFILFRPLQLPSKEREQERWAGKQGQVREDRKKGGGGLGGGGGGRGGQGRAGAPKEVEKGRQVRQKHGNPGWKKTGTVSTRLGGGYLRQPSRRLGLWPRRIRQTNTHSLPIFYGHAGAVEDFAISIFYCSF